VKEIVEGSIDSPRFSTVQQVYVGRPAQAVDVTHGGEVTLAQIIAGKVPEALRPRLTSYDARTVDI
jgi:hypothetical protein